MSDERKDHLEHDLAAETFRSISWRVARMKLYSEDGGEVFQNPLQYTADPRLMKLAQAPKLKVLPELIYHREATRSYVSRLGDHLVCKVFAIDHRYPGGSSLLEPFEVEARYLKIFSVLLAHGIIDSSALLLGTCVMTRQEVEKSGYLPEEMKMFDMKIKRKGQTAAERSRASMTHPELYAIIFAEAGDTSVSSYMANLCHQPQYSCSQLTYGIRALLLQIIFTLASIHRVFPSYKHLDLHASNWLVQKIDAPALRKQLKLGTETPMVVEYAFGSRRWQLSLDRAPFRVLLWDMNFSSINPEDVEPYGIDLVTARVRDYNRVVPLPRSETNQYVDVAKTVDTMRWVLEQGKNHTMKDLPLEMQQFFERVIPRDLSLSNVKPDDKDSKRERLEHVHHPGIDVLTPQKLLEDPIFSCLRVPERGERPRAVYRLKGHSLLTPVNTSKVED
jgi:hypothetical protein